MRDGEVRDITGAWSYDDNAWVSEAICLTGDSYLEIKLQDKGRLVIKKSETENGPWPKALITPWTGPDFKTRLYGSSKYRYVKIYLTSRPVMIQISSIKGYAVRRS